MGLRSRYSDLLDSREEGVQIAVTATFSNETLIFQRVQDTIGAHGSADGRSFMLQLGRSRILFPDNVNFFNEPNHSGRTRPCGLQKL
jgi:hypothetical protein